MKAIHKALVLSALVTSSGAAIANNISLFETQFDTDWAYAGVGGLRGTGASSISLSGVSGTVSKAYLYWHGPTDSTDPNFQANISFGSNAITGTNIGFSDDNFWGQANSQAYRADVTSIVTGNGAYGISGLNPANSNGASLVVFYDDGNTANNRDVVLFNGNDANFNNAFDADGWNVNLNGINYSSGTAQMTLHVSDGQDFGTGDDGNFLVNGVMVNNGDEFDGTTVPNTAGTSVANGALWDIVSFDVTSFLSVGPNNLNLTHTAVNDALSLIVAAIDLPAGSAPDQPPGNGVPEPATLALLGLGLIGLYGMRRQNDRGSSSRIG